ncbi:efflux RND transporter permease subunit [Nannocystis radixulma]|uniref:CusA/CzcA family heavy metal efflux RND transporter n=1 Tax=Nannocystis radixulma TaxID=2995305 RepID=A0ABT5B5K5_9BACT|nr:CusA/CzcA family heavy metal efflux RND transporter [Nannocystis radixulma]MDC0669391.1 CusA/CzcA family heavy metal efflux RND transporter [Nannocystis radixulma]
MIRTLVRLCVEKRLAAIIVTFVLALYGVSAYVQTPIEAYPDVTNVQVNVIAQMPGFAPEEIERQVTIPLERALNGTPDMVQMRSESLFGLSLIWLVFNDEADPFKARMRVAERLQGLDLSEGVNVRIAPDATPLGKVFYYRVVSDRHTLYELRTEQEWTIVRHLKQVPGVADVVGMGGFVREHHVEVDPARLATYGLTLTDVTEALAKSNRNVGGGYQRHGQEQLVIRGIGLLEDADDIRDAVLANEGGTPVTIGDVAQVIEANTPRQGSVGFNDQKDIVQGVVLLRRGENPDTVLKGVKAKIEELNTKILPEGMSLVPMYDRSVLIEHTLHTVYENLLVGFVLVSGLGWLFLRSVRGSLIVAVTIPLALLTAFTGLYLLGLPANLISMGAIDFGIIVDGAVVLVENVIHEARVQKPPDKKSMLEVVTHSAISVSGPAFFAMAINIAALIPVFTLQGVEGRIFSPLALTYTFALLGALAFSLTVVPALCAVFMRPKDGDISDPKFLVILREWYRKVLVVLLARRFVAIVAGLALLAAGAVAARDLGTEFLPELDEGDLYVFVEMPPSVSLEAGQDILQEVRRKMLEFPEIESTPSEQGRPEDGMDNEGINMAKVFGRLKPKSEWRAGLTKEMLIDQVRESLTEIPSVRFNFSQPIRDSVEEAVSGVRGKIVVKVFGTDLQQMRSTLLDVIEAIKDVPGVVDLGIYRDSIIPQLQITLDRKALARNGISVHDAETVIETALAGTTVTNMWDKERIIPTRVRLPPVEKSDLNAVAELLIPSPLGARVPLRDLAKVEVSTGRASVIREANSRYLAIKFNIEGRDMGSTVAEAMETAARKVVVPEGEYLVWGGEFENQQRAMARLRIIVPIAVLIVFGLLYAALGSGMSALVIMLSVPFALTGGVFVLRLTGIPLSVSAAVGFIALLGQVSMAGLLMISGVDQRRREGLALREAVIESGVDRFRARLMTGLLAMCGLMPMAVSTSMGSEVQRPFALVIVGGMVTTLFVALFFLPALYSYLAPKQAAKQHEAH